MKTKEFIKEFKQAFTEGDEQRKKELSNYLNFDYRIRLKDLQKHLNEEEFEYLKKQRKKEFDLEEYILHMLVDETANMVYKFLKSRYGRKVVKAVVKRVKEETKDVPEGFLKRETDIVLFQKIKLQTVFSKSFPLFVKYLSKLKIL